MVNSTNTDNASRGAALPIAAENTAIDRQEVQRLAQQFEAMLMTQMLREMRRSMLDDQEEQEDGFGAGAMTDTADIALANGLSSVGGLGLTDSLLKAFERQIAPQQAIVPSGQDAFVSPQAALAPPQAADGPRPTAAAAAPLLTDIASEAPVSSRFGWRHDPLTGIERFHAGVDIALAYGQDVRAAASGTVSFAGVQNGYGTTVVVDHGDGRQTRYAHLSESLVRAGESVAEGRVVGKSGNSGRSTGPHLHFEMLVDGQAVDPMHTVAE